MSMKKRGSGNSPPPLWMIKVRKRLPIIIAVGIFVTLYVGGLFAQLTGRISGKTEFSFGIIHSILANFTVGPQCAIMVCMGYCALGYWAILRYKDKTSRDLASDDRGFEIEGSGTYGTASLLDLDEARNFVEVEPLERTAGFILGKFIVDDDTGTDKVVSVPPDGKRFAYTPSGKPLMVTNDKGERIHKREKLPFNGNRHVMVIGPSGSGKSYCYSRPNLFQSILHGESVIVTDPKGELYADTAKYAEEHGYVVKILNLAWPNGSDAVDFLGEVQGDQIGIEAQTFANIVIANTENPNGGGDAAYSNGEKNLLTALVLFIITAPQSMLQSSAGDYFPKTFGGVYQLLCESLEFIEERFELLSRIDPKNPALGPWAIFKDGSESFRGNLRTGLGNRLTVLNDDVIKNITGNKEIDLVLPRQTKCVYYVIMDDMKDTFKFLSSLFFTYLVNRLVEYSRKQPSLRLPVPVNMLLDEFIAIGRLPDFEKKLATVRSAGISISMIFQNKPQLDAAYPDGLSDTMIGNCSTILCLACNDMETATYLSERSGTATVALEQTRVSRPVIPMGTVPTDVQYGYSLGQRYVLNPDEVIRLDPGKVLIGITSANLFMANKFPYTDLVTDSELGKVNMYDHVPAWRQRLSSIDTGEKVQEVDDSYVRSAPKASSLMRRDIEPTSVAESKEETEAIQVEPAFAFAQAAGDSLHTETDDDVTDADEITNPERPDIAIEEKAARLQEGIQSLADDSRNILNGF